MLAIRSDDFDKSLNRIKRVFPSTDTRFSLLLATTLSDLLPNPKPEQACDDWINEHTESINNAYALLGEYTNINFPTLTNYTRNALKLRYSFINAQATTLYHYNIRSVFTSEAVISLTQNEEQFTACRQHAVLVLQELMQA